MAGPSTFWSLVFGQTSSDKQIPKINFELTDATPLNFITRVFQIAYLSSSFRLLSRPHRRHQIKIVVFACYFKNSRHRKRRHRPYKIVLPLQPVFSRCKFSNSGVRDMSKVRNSFLVISAKARSLGKRVRKRRLHNCWLSCLRKH
ncbi:unnamed protein product [Lactuca saligna]|uniref:Uncharacterized protein n=1 Tax=Lactuca saligna TaxID=75948 RepID=A0AA35ZAR8_LACSI|nr:unnamed protein product [Lactuca saligna]